MYRLCYSDVYFSYLNEGLKIKVIEDNVTPNQAVLNNSIKTHFNLTIQPSPYRSASAGVEIFTHVAKDADMELAIEANMNLCKESTMKLLKEAKDIVGRIERG
jgi:hypothetical protein